MYEAINNVVYESARNNCILVVRPEPGRDETADAINLNAACDLATKIAEILNNAPALSLAARAAGLHPIAEILGNL